MRVPQPPAVSKRPLLIFCVVVGVVLFWYFARVKTIICTVDSQPCSEEVSAQLRSIHGQQIVGVDVQTAAKKALSEQPVTVLSLKKRLPSTVYIMLQSQPFQYAVASAETVRPVTTVGTLYTVPAPTKLVQIAVTPDVLQSALQEEKHLQPEIHTALTATAAYVQSLDEKPARIELLDTTSIRITMKSGAKILLPVAKNAESLVQLGMILTAPEYARLQSEYTEIDLRFKLPVLRKSQ